MSAHSVKLKYETTRFEDDGSGMKETKCEESVYISSNKARKLLKEKAARIDSRQPFVLRLVPQREPTEYKVQRWSSKSGSVRMNGALLERKPPRR